MKNSLFYFSVICPSYWRAGARIRFEGGYSTDRIPVALTMAVGNPSLYYRVAQKIGTLCTPYNFIKYWPIFKLFFTVRIRRKFIITLSTQVCHYTTLWNVSVLKATIENKITSVTTHFKSASFSSKAVMRTRWTFDVKLQDVTVTLDNNWDNKHVVSCLIS